MALYNDLMRRDVLTMAQGLLDSKVLRLRDSDGKLEIYDTAMAWNTPWHHVRLGERANCHFWNTIMFQNIFKRLPYSLLQNRKFIPSGCVDCFKVVVRPKTLKQLFALVELQKQLNIDCKCGIEQREHVFGLYGGYFYGRGLKEGLENYKTVRKAVDEDPILGSDTKVILKRGCTEMEHEVGPSDKWEIYPEQIEVERLLYVKFNTDRIIYNQPSHSVDYVHGKWIRFAYQWGDETVFEYIDPNLPLYRPYVTYHHLLEEKKDDHESSVSGGLSGIRGGLRGIRSGISGADALQEGRNDPGEGQGAESGIQGDAQAAEGRDKKEAEEKESA